jgi:hypothetical protein
MSRGVLVAPLSPLRRTNSGGRWSDVERIPVMTCAAFDERFAPADRREVGAKAAS